MNKYLMCGQCGVYFLLNKWEIVYIGKTRNYPFRISAHYKKKKFDSVRFIGCHKSSLLAYEQRWIRRFTPKYNLQSNPKVKSKAGAKAFYTHQTLEKYGIGV